MPRLQFYGWAGIVFAAFIASLGMMAGSLYLALGGEIEAEVASLSITAALILVTAVYAYITFLLLWESIKDREQRAKPTLVLFSQGSSEDNLLVVKNIGNGPAIDLSINARLKPGSPQPEIQIDDTHLAVGHSKSLVQGEFIKLQPSRSSVYENYERVVADFEYKSSTGKRYSDSMTIELSDINHTSRFPA